MLSAEMLERDEGKFALYGKNAIFAKCNNKLSIKIVKSVFFFVFCVLFFNKKYRMKHIKTSKKIVAK